MTEEERRKNRVRLRGVHEELFGMQIMLPEVCLNLRMSLNGAADPWPEGNLRRVLAYLRERLLFWEPSLLEKDRRMDDAVRKLIEATLAYAEPPKPAGEGLKPGDRVLIRHCGGQRGRIVEDRGPLGYGGKRVFAVLLRRKPRKVRVELCEDQLERIENETSEENGGDAEKQPT